MFAKKKTLFVVFPEEVIMSYSKKTMDTALQRLELRKAENSRIAQRRRAEICSVIPEYGALESQLANTMTRSVAAIAEKRSDSQSIIAKALDENAEIQAKMKWLLKDDGFSEDYLDPIYTCEKCHDSGTVDGHWCDCFIKLLNVAASEELNASSPLKLCTFESFDLSLYPEVIDPEVGHNQHTVMKNNLKECQSFADNFSGSGCGLLMLGKTGLGKTHLSLAIANEVIKKGFSVVYNSAPELMRQLEKESFGRADTDTMQLITACDLLILDDLGAEMKSDRYISMLYEIINARQNRQTPMIINSNLTADEIKNRYQDRIWSRLFSLNVLLFCGSDNRLKRN